VDAANYFLFRPATAPPAMPLQSLLDYAPTLSLLLPQSPGLLPKWLLLVSTMAVFNTVQNFATLKLTRKIYNNVPPSSGT